MAGKGKPQIFAIKVVCAGCNQVLYKYRKEGGGHLLKCFLSGITTDNTKQPCICPKCNAQFANPGTVKGRPAHIIIQGKVRVVGHCGKK